ncbi:hypothetical protein ABZR88_09710 [Mucilaginibacter yixingensis]|nr:hypothetical protein [Mucilaginibacter yixingensis]
MSEIDYNDVQDRTSQTETEQYSLEERIAALTDQKQNWYYMASQLYNVEDTFTMIKYYQDKRGGVKFSDEILRLQKLNAASGDEAKINRAITQKVVIGQSLYKHDIVVLVRDLYKGTQVSLPLDRIATHCFERFQELFLLTKESKTVTRVNPETNKEEKVTLIRYTPVLALYVQDDN